MAPLVERLEGQIGQLCRAEGRKGGDPYRPSEAQHLVMDHRQLVEHARQGGGDRRVRMDDGARLISPVDTQMERKLRCRAERAVDMAGVEIYDRYVLGAQLGQDGACGRHGDEVVGALGDVSGCPQDQPCAGHAPACCRDALTLSVEHPWARSGRRLYPQAQPR